MGLRRDRDPALEYDSDLDGDRLARLGVPLRREVLEFGRGNAQRG